MKNVTLSQSSFLIVDDDEFSRDVITDVLTHLGGANIFCAHDHPSALSMAQKHRPDFVLLDIYLPEPDGWEVLREIRKILPKTAVVMITGAGTPDDFLKSVNEHVDGYCMKPVLPDIMAKTLASAQLHRQGAGLTSH